MITKTFRLMMNMVKNMTFSKINNFIMGHRSKIQMKNSKLRMNKSKKRIKKYQDLTCMSIN